MKIKSKKRIKTIIAAFNQLNPLEKSGLIKKDPSRQKYLNNIAKIRTPNRVIIPPILFCLGIHRTTFAIALRLCSPMKVSNSAKFQELYCILRKLNKLQYVSWISFLPG